MAIILLLEYVADTQEQDFMEMGLVHTLLSMVGMGMIVDLIGIQTLIYTSDFNLDTLSHPMIVIQTIVFTLW